MNQSNSKLENRNYILGSDYSFEVEKKGNLYHFYFRSSTGGLIGYIKMQYKLIRDGKFSLERCIIIDTISSHKLTKNTSPKAIEFFETNGYNGDEFAGFGTYMYECALSYIRDGFGADISIFFDAYPKNTEVIRSLVERTEERTNNLIRSSGWARDYVIMVNLQEKENDSTQE